MMNYLITLAICSCWLLSGARTKTKQSNTANEGLSRGLNDVAVDFHDRTSQIQNSTSEMVSSGDHSTSKWIWKPIGHKINDINSAAIVGLFENDSGSGEDDGVYEEPVNDGVYEEPVNETQTSREEIWTFNETIQDRVDTTQSPKTMDRKRNKTEEKAHLIYEKHLKKSNWCFKDNEKAKSNSNFKKAEACCRRRRECRGRRRHIKRGIYACSCDIYFHICLKKADTKMAKSIENMYFNRNIVCYKKQRKVCTNEPCEDTTYLWKIISRQPK